MQLDRVLPATRVELKTLGNTPAIYVTGKIEFGLSRELMKILKTGSDVRKIVINSPGGVLTEARGTALVIQREQLETHVDEKCYSACTLVFAAGSLRTIGPAARIGFHQYALQGLFTPPGVDLEADQKKDAQFFRKQGFDDAFVERIFRESHDSMWIPDSETLVSAGVAHRVLQTSKGNVSQ